MHAPAAHVQHRVRSARTRGQVAHSAEKHDELPRAPRALVTPAATRAHGAHGGWQGRCARARVAQAVGEAHELVELHEPAEVGVVAGEHLRSLASVRVDA